MKNAAAQRPAGVSGRLLWCCGADRASFDGPPPVPLPPAQPVGGDVLRSAFAGRCPQQPEAVAFPWAANVRAPGCSAKPMAIFSTRSTTLPAPSGLIVSALSAGECSSSCPPVITKSAGTPTFQKLTWSDPVPPRSLTTCRPLSRSSGSSRPVNSVAVPTPDSQRVSRRIRPTMSRFNIAWILSSGMGVFSTKCREPLSPVSSAANAINRIDRRLASFPDAAYASASRFARTRTAAVPDALSSAPGSNLPPA